MSYLSNYDFDNFGNNFELNSDFEPGIDFEQEQDQGALVRENEDNDNEAHSFIYASDASFADNMLDRKSSQGYIMLLFDGTII